MKDRIILESVEKQIMRRDVLYGEATTNSINTSKIFRNSVKVGNQDNSFPLPSIQYINKDTVSAFFDIEVSNNERVCILNFASYTSPGGGYIYGAMAQEEALCAQSNLYNIICSESFKSEYEHNSENAKDTKGIYEDWAIYTPEVVFETKDMKLSDIADVVTCPAPNKRSIISNFGPGEAEDVNRTAMDQRIRFMLDVCSDNTPNVNTLIIGAWGCGIFGQNVKEVAKLFKKHIKSGRYQFDRIVIAVPEESKLNIFKEEFKEQ